MAHSSPVPRLYRTVVDDVISNVRESFLDEGVDEQVLQELKQLWESKLVQSKAVDGMGVGAVDTQKIIQQHQAQQMLLLQQQARQIHQTKDIQEPSQVGRKPMPMYAQLCGTNMTGAATAAALALQPVYQQQLGQLGTSNIVLQQNSQGQIVAVPQGQLIQGSRQVTSQPPSTLAQQQPSTSQAPGRSGQGPIIQLDGANDTSSEEDDDDDGDDNDNDEEDEQAEENGADGEEEEPLNSGDDVSEDDPSEVFDTDNVVVCQYDKINRSKNKWKFHLKDGIMNLNGTDYVFQKANGDAEW